MRPGESQQTKHVRPAEIHQTLTHVDRKKANKQNTRDQDKANKQNTSDQTKANKQNTSDQTKANKQNTSDQQKANKQNTSDQQKANKQNTSDQTKANKHNTRHTRRKPPHHHPRRQEENQQTQHVRPGQIQQRTTHGDRKKTNKHSTSDQDKSSKGPPTETGRKPTNTARQTRTNPAKDHPRRQEENQQTQHVRPGQIQQRTTHGDRRAGCRSTAPGPGRIVPCCRTAGSPGCSCSRRRRPPGRTPPPSLRSAAPRGSGSA